MELHPRYSPLHGEVRSRAERCEGPRDAVARCVADAAKAAGFADVSYELLDLDGNPADPASARMVRVVARDVDGNTHVFVIALVGFGERVRAVWVQSAVYEHG